VRARGWAATGLSVVALFWGGAGYLDTGPADFHDYRVAAVGAARSARDALASAELTGKAVLAGKVTAPYAGSMLDDARDALAAAAERFRDASPPDGAAEALRDELEPLLVRANTVLSGLDSEVTDETVRRVDPVAGGLDDFVERHG
jgi:hypothetical protein